MRKLLIIQQDEAYFLFETIQVLEKERSAFKDFDVTFLVNPKAFQQVFENTTPLLPWFTTDTNKVVSETFDMSVNLSLNEESWVLHGNVAASTKIGPYKEDNVVSVNDLWSSYLMTIKAKAPFLTFHLQDIFKNILGIKSFHHVEKKPSSVRQIAFGASATHFYSGHDQETLIHELALSYPNFPIKDLTEIDLFNDVSHTLYIGPATLAALKFCEAGGRVIFIASHFQGMNLLPHSEGQLFISTRGDRMETKHLLPLIEQEISGRELPKSPYSLYRIEHEVSGAYLKALNEKDDNYPFYQTHLVLWNFLLNLFDTNLEVTRCSKNQLEQLKYHQVVLTKILRLQDYALVSLDTVYQEAKSTLADAEKIEGHLKNLREIDVLTDQIANTHSFIRPILDFYRIRKGQNSGISLREQSEQSILTYTEEHQALKALDELFSVTLKRNEVSI